MRKFVFFMDFIFPVFPITLLLILASLQIGWMAIIIPVITSVVWMVYYHGFRHKIDIEEEPLFWKIFGWMI